MLRLDVDFVFEQTEGPKGLLSLLQRHLPNQDVTYATVQMWRQRGRIAGAWVPSVIYVLLREGVSPFSCFVDDSEFRG